MWCKHCRQDVPALAAADSSAIAGDDSAPTADGGRFACARCGEPIGSDPKFKAWANVSDLGIELDALPLATSSAETAAARSAPKHKDASTRYDSWQWELDQELHDVRRVLQRRSVLPPPAQRRIDPPQPAPEPVLAVAVPTPIVAEYAGPGPEYGVPSTQYRVPSTSRPAPVLTPSPVPVVSTTVTARPRLKTWSPMAWLILMLGMTATCCGGALMAWSVLSGRTELWNQGVPILIGGQVALFISLMAMLLRLARQSQSTHVRLHEMDNRLAHLGRSGNPPFYVHLAEGAPPQTLVTDLKNQLDLLSIRMQH